MTSDVCEVLLGWIGRGTKTRRFLPGCGERCWVVPLGLSAFFVDRDLSRYGGAAADLLTMLRRCLLVEGRDCGCLLALSRGGAGLDTVVASFGWVGTRDMYWYCAVVRRPLGSVC